MKDVLTELYMNDIRMGEGKALKAEMSSGESLIVLSTNLDNNKIKDWFSSHVKNGEKTEIKLKGYLVFDLRIMEFKYPFEKLNVLNTDFLSGLKSQTPRDLKVGPVTLKIKSIDILGKS